MYYMWHAAARALRRAVRVESPTSLQDPSISMASQLFNDLGRTSDAQQRVSDSDCLLALEAAGADPNVVLTDAEREHLLTRGYLNLGQLMTSEQCEEAKRRIHAQTEVEEEGVPFSKGSDGENLRLSNLFNLCNDDGMFDVVVTHPRLLAAMRLMLGDSFKLSSLNFRAASPGHGLQGYHTDWGENLASLQDPPEFQVCNSVRDLQQQQRRLPAITNRLVHAV